MTDYSAIDHLVIAGPDLDQLCSWWEASTGRPATPGGAHTGMGTRNALAGIDGSTYIELIGPDSEQPDHDGPRPFGINDLDEMRFVTFAVAVTDLEKACAAVAAQGIEPGVIRPMERARPDGGRLSWRLATPPDPELGGVMPFLIEWGEQTPHPAASLASDCGLSDLVLSHPQADRIGAAVLAATGCRLAVEVGEPGVIGVLSTANGELQLP